MKVHDMVRLWWTERLADTPEKNFPKLLHEYIVDM